MTTADRTFEYYPLVRTQVVTERELCKTKPEKAGLAVALDVFINLCEQSIADHGIARINTEEALKILTSRLTNGMIEDLGPIEEIYVRGQLNMAMGYCETFYYHRLLAAR